MSNTSKLYSRLILGIIGMGIITHSNAVEINKDFSLNTTLELVSDYRAFGTSMTKNNPALQLNSMLIHSSGLLFGIWGSNVDYYGAKTKLETGYYAGFNHAFNENWNLYATLGHYHYPRSSNYDADEFFGMLTYKKFVYSMTYDYNMEGIPNDAIYGFGYNFSLPSDINLYAEAGLNHLGYELSSTKDDRGYYYWLLKASKTFHGLSFSVTYTDTNLSKEGCTYAVGGRNLCSPTVVFGVKKSF